MEGPRAARGAGGRCRPAPRGPSSAHPRRGAPGPLHILLRLFNVRVRLQCARLPERRYMLPPFHYAAILSCRYSSGNVRYDAAEDSVIRRSFGMALVLANVVHPLDSVAQGARAWHNNRSEIASANTTEYVYMWDWPFSFLTALTASSSSLPI